VALFSFFPPTTAVGKELPHPPPLERGRSLSVLPASRSLFSDDLLSEILFFFLFAVAHNALFPGAVTLPAGLPLGDEAVPPPAGNEPLTADALFYRLLAFCCWFERFFFSTKKTIFNAFSEVGFQFFSVTLVSFFPQEESSWFLGRRQGPSVHGLFFPALFLAQTLFLRPGRTSRRVRSFGPWAGPTFFFSPNLILGGGGSQPPWAKGPADFSLTATGRAKGEIGHLFRRPL